MSLDYYLYNIECKMYKPNINLFIVGAVKSGTTSLYHYLKQHNSVFFPLVKEPNYYSDINSEEKHVYQKPKPNKFYHNKIINNKEDYFSLYKGSEDYTIVGDASPSYLWDTNSAARIKKDFPNAKIIIILRNPAQRAFSHYLMNLRSGLEKEEDFLTALLRDEKNKHQIWGDNKSMLYTSLGMYSSQVQSYYDHFEKKDIKVLIYEDFYENVESGISKLFEFLEIPDIQSHTLNLDGSYNVYKSPKNKLAKFFISNKKRLNLVRKFTPSRIKDLILFKDSSKPKIDERANVYLSELFKEDIENLEKKLGRNLNAWK